MSIEIQALDQVPEGSIKKIIKEFASVGANMITAVNDGKGTFSIEATFIDAGPQRSLTKSGKMSTFGGPQDMGVSASEGLALFDTSNMGTAPAGLFLATPPPGTTGLARRLNPAFNYLACRWDYTVTPLDFLRRNLITVSANGKSIPAQAADFGPNVATGRVADLSPGLAHALGLQTDDNCTLVIPLPAGTAIPIPAAGPATGVDRAAIDAMTFPADMTRTLVVVTTSDNTTLWLVNLIGANEGGQTLMRQVAGNPPEILRSDSVLLPIQADAQISDTVAAELNKAIQKEPEISSVPAGPAPAASDNIDAKMFATAKAFVGHDTSHVPGTDGGNLACAWAVNEVTRIALGKAISTDGQGKNGLSTVGIFDALKAHHTKLSSADTAKPGALIIAPTQGATHGHVGIVGASTGGVADTQVFSNKSHPGVFAQNFTIGSFTSQYTKKGLEVLFFELNPAQFALGS